jgi:micrococcal nuclease
VGRLILVLFVVGALLLLLRAVGVYLVLGAIGLVVLAAWRPDVVWRITGSASLGWLPAWIGATPLRLTAALALVLMAATALAYGVVPNDAVVSPSAPGLVGGGASTPQASPSATVGPHRTPRVQPSARPSRGGKSVSLSAHGPTGPTRRARVTEVIDGDTIWVALGGRSYKVRYIGIDTPETHFGIEWMGPEATAANARLVGGRTVFLEKDVSETDRYGRLLRFIWLHEANGWLFVNAELLREGFAQVTTYPPDVKYADTVFLAAQRRARQHNRGLWGP